MACEEEREALLRARKREDAARAAYEAVTATEPLPQSPVTGGIPFERMSALQAELEAAEAEVAGARKQLARCEGRT